MNLTAYDIKVAQERRRQMMRDAQQQRLAQEVMQAQAAQHERTRWNFQRLARVIAMFL